MARPPSTCGVGSGSGVPWLVGNPATDQRTTTGSPSPADWPPAAGLPLGEDYHRGLLFQRARWERFRTGIHWIKDNSPPPTPLAPCTVWFLAPLALLDWCVSVTLSLLNFSPDFTPAKKGREGAQLTSARAPAPLRARVER